MADIFAVSSYLDELGAAPDPVRRHKLLYFIQAWSQQWAGVPLFPDEPQAWKNGPVYPRVRNDRKFHYGRAHLRAGGLSSGEKQVIEDVVSHYGGFSTDELIAESHATEPWKAARAGLAASEPSNNPISLEAMEAYFWGFDGPFHRPVLPERFPTYEESAATVERINRDHAGLLELLGQ